MNDQIPLTAADLARQKSLFSVCEQNLALEFAGLSGLQIAELAFSRLTKPDPFHLFCTQEHGDTVLMLGTDQRDQLVPKLAESLLALPDDGLVLDIGSGDGQTMSYALEGRSAPLGIVPLDPMAGDLDKYADVVGTPNSQISVPRRINSGIDELITAQLAEPGKLSERFDAIVSVHSLYFSADPPGVLSFALDHLVPGGRLLMVFSAGWGRFTGSMAIGYFDHYDLDREGKLRSSKSKLGQMIGLTSGSPPQPECQAALVRALSREDFCVTEVIQQPTRVYGHDLGDMIAFAFINMLPLAGDRNLERKIAYVSKRLRTSPEAFDLRIQTSGPRARMYSVAQPQIFLALEKN
ncbi:MAG: class I SAM-dependent methyltransferase [Hyphomicrobiales bacterium]|nr:class I SAM-dependent methyltransferase [Hyphomicrobiales bacterium]MCP5001447.1 class I SAM-dependent methyltransferase [Hyphomicrobiales bacterium]